MRKTDDLLNESIYFPRRRIEKLLDSACRPPLVVVSASAGYGKTTAVREYMKKKGSPCAWVSLSCGDELVF